MNRKRHLAVGLAFVLLLCIPGGRAQGPGQGQGGDPAMAGMGRMVRGTVTAATPEKLTVKTETGEIYQVALNPNTRLTRDRQPLKASEIHVGDGIGAMGEIDQPNKTVHAIFVAIVDAEQIKKAREAMGKTYIAGKVTAIDDLKLTIQRADGVAQVIAVDEDTSFRKGMRGMQMAFGIPAGGGPQGAGASQATGGESITLGDIKVGDTVAGPGTLKHGIFVPTMLGVGDPAQGNGGRRRRQSGDPASAPSAPNGGQN